MARRAKTAAELAAEVEADIRSLCAGGLGAVQTPPRPRPARRAKRPAGKAA